MRRSRAWLPVLLTLMALAFGYFLPQCVCAVLDKKSHDLSESIETENVTLSFAPELSIGEKLQNGMRSIAYTTQLASGKKLDEESAREAALKIMDEMSAFGIVNSSAYTFDMVSPVLAVYDNDTADSYILWQCSYFDGDGNYTDLIIDDETGCLIAMTYSSYDSVESSANIYDGDGMPSEGMPYYEAEVSESYSVEIAYMLGEYLCVSYGFSYYELSQDFTEYSLEYNLIFYDVQGEPYRTTLTMGPNYFLFNY